MNITLGQHVGVMGQTGAGKTYFVREVVLPEASRVLVVDSEEGFDFSPAEYRVVPIDRLRKELIKAKGKPFRLAVRPANDVEMDQVAAIVLDVGRNMVLYVDEVTDFSDAQHISPTMRALVRKARKRGVTVAWGTQRAAGGNRWLMSNSAHLYVFYITPDDRLRMKDHFGKETLAAMDRLGYGRHDFLYLGPDRKIEYYGGTE